MGAIGFGAFGFSTLLIYCGIKDKSLACVIRNGVTGEKTDCSNPSTVYTKLGDVIGSVANALSGVAHFAANPVESTIDGILPGDPYKWVQGAPVVGGLLPK